MKILSIPTALKARSGTRPPLALVVASAVAAVAIWLPIYLRAGRLIWFW
jgi:hypothetical protein